MYPLSNATKNLQDTIDIAQRTAAMTGTSFVGSEHFIYAFLCVPACKACGILLGEGVTREEYGKYLSFKVDKEYQGQGMTPRTQKMYDNAVVGAKSMGMLAGTAHLLFEILNTPNCLGVNFLRHFADIESLKQKTLTTIRELGYRKQFGMPENRPSNVQAQSFLDFSGFTESSPWSAKEEQSSNTFSVNNTFNSSNSSGNFGESSSKKFDFDLDNNNKKSTKTISASAAEKLLGYGIDMTERARRGKIDPVIGRKEEIEGTEKIRKETIGRINKAKK